MTHWDYHNPVRVIFGSGCLNDLPTLVRGMRVLLITTPGFTRRGVTGRARELLGSALVHIIDDVGPNPDLDDLERKAKAIGRDSLDGIVAIGGGSVIDTAKVIGFLLTRSGLSLRDYFASNDGRLAGKGMPIFAVPTTAGTGSEVTPFATIWDSTNRRKHSLSGPQLFPQVAVIDPELTLSLPKDVTVTCGLDAISQAFEAIWNRNATPITTLYATEALKIGIPTLEQLVGDLRNVHLRAWMLRASVLAGLAISNTRTAIAHSMSYPITMHYRVPHGLACSFMLPAVLAFNSEVDDGRLLNLAGALGHDSIADLHAQMTRLLDVLDVDGMLKEYFASTEELRELIPEMLTPGRADNNLRDVDHEDLEWILGADKRSAGRG